MEFENTRPVIRTRPEHCISRKNIDKDALTVLYRLSRNGFIAHLVGGGVRDLLLGREPKDFDVGTDAQPRQIKRLFRNCFLIGRRFRLAHIRFQDKVIETSTFRRQPELECDPHDPEADIYSHRDNTFGTPVEDACRRDFTINGLFYDIRTFSVIDHVGGLDDLEKRLIRSIGDPNIRFREDPVRMLRAVRFAARLDFDIERETYDAIMRQRHEILKASPPRLIEEIYRLFAFKSGRKAVRLLRETGLLEPLFPEVNAWLDDNDGPNCPLWAMLDALDEGLHAAGQTTSALVFATLFYPIWRQQMQKAWDDSDNVNPADVARDIIADTAERFQMPRAVYYRFLQLFGNQQRLEPARRQRGARSRFAAQEAFPETLALYELAASAGWGSTEAANSWRAVLNDLQDAQERTPAPKYPDPELPAGPRPRRKRSGTADEDAAPPALLAPTADDNDQPRPRRRKRRRRGGRHRRPGGEGAVAEA